MMREMSYRDKMIVLIITVIIILAVGFFALIRPKYNAYVADKQTYETTKTEWEGLEAKINQIPVLKETITASYNESKKIAELFVNEAFQPANDTFDDTKVNLIVDQYIQPAVDESQLQVTKLEMGGVDTATLEYYYYTPDVVTYSLLESADINGNYAKEVTELLKVGTALQEKELAEVMINEVKLTVNGKKENLMAFLTAMAEDENAVRITGVDIDDYSFGAGQTQTIEEQQTAEDGTVTTVTREVPVAADGQGLSEMEISMAFYNAKPIDEPVLGD